MKYISTRGRMEPVGFLDAVMTGLAPDGGLLLPESLPSIGSKLELWKDLSYQELAFEVMSLFISDIPAEDLKALIEKSYSTFRTPDVTPVIPVNGFHVLELWHGPTLAFKDVALQFLGNLFEYVLEQRGGQLNILGATSGDTGSAAIYGVHGKKNIRIFIMHPKGRTSPVQEKQMTSVLDDNVFNLAVEGTFDDCQHLMKSIFSDVAFKTEHSLGSVNSVNWARVLAQIVYYFYAAFRVQENTGASKVQFAVPTGNFGDIMAGYIAAQMGLPVKKLILATNENNILSRFFNTGVYSMGEVVPTISPSMDIQVASNFERYLYYRCGQDAAKLRELMDSFAKNKTLTVDGTDDLFAAGEAGTAQTLAMIKKCYETESYILDPHTAVGIAVAERFADSAVPTICLATAHPAKFNEAIEQAIGAAAHHPALDKLANAETRCDTIANDEAAVRQYLVKKIVTGEEATKVLKLLIKDCEKLSKDPDLSRRIGNELREAVKGWESILIADSLTPQKLCHLIVDVWQEFLVAKKTVPNFDRQHPDNIRHLEEAKKNVRILGKGKIWFPTSDRGKQESPFDLEPDPQVSDFIGRARI